MIADEAGDHAAEACEALDERGREDIEAVRPAVVAEIPDDLHLLPLRRREHRGNGRKIVSAAWPLDEVPANGVARGAHADAT